MKKLIASALVALAAMTAIPAAADTFTITNNAAYNLEVKWYKYANSYGEHVFDDFLLAGQSMMFNNEDHKWIEVRAHVPGYGWNRIKLHEGDTNYTLNTYGTATIFNPPNFAWSSN